ncbi:hypothetical protein ACLB2K_031878 [Fragaria x ananassa]
MVLMIIHHGGVARMSVYRKYVGGGACRDWRAVYELCSITLVTGLLILLRSATKITHKAQAVACLATKLHVCATLESFDATELDSPTAQQVANDPGIHIITHEESDGDEVSDEEDDLENTKMVPSYAYNTISYRKRQALVTYLENNKAGITVYGFTLDRTTLQMLFMIEFSLILWLLGKTISGISQEGTSFRHRATGMWDFPRVDSMGTPFVAGACRLHTSSVKIVPISSCSKEHQKIYREWFQFADSDSDGRITGSDAMKFFSMSNLSRQDLKQVWAITDSKRQGFLGFTEFVAAMQLVSLAQAGNEITNDLLTRNGGLLLFCFLTSCSVFFFFCRLGKLEASSHGGVGCVISEKKHSNKTNENEVNGNPVVQQSPSALWFSSKSSKKLSVPLSAVTSIVDGLKRLYVQKLKPLEVTYKFNDFVSPLLTNSDFDAKPMVMLLGQYSTGKTTFIKHLLKTSYPGAHIGPEPTTDRFVVVMSGSDERSVPGNTIAVQADMPFSGLTSFGTAFLSKFECSQIPHSLLEHITFVDTPGVLSGEKQRTQRAYDFTGVTSWFASKCDLILLLFDPHKLDVSDEFKRVISSLRGHDDKIRVVLNKADQIDTQQLMRVYGALMWSLGKVLNTPEVMRVYIGSFNDKPVNEAASGPIGKELFEREQEDLLAALKDIPKKSCDRRINEFVKRARAAKIHAYIISHLRKEMPALIGKAKTQQKLMDNLEDEFKKVQREFHLPSGDFPNVEQFRETLSGYSFDNFEKLKPSMIKAVDDMLGYDIPELLKNFRNPYD